MIASSQGSDSQRPFLGFPTSRLFQVQGEEVLGTSVFKVSLIILCSCFFLLEKGDCHTASLGSSCGGQGDGKGTTLSSIVFH